MFTKVLTNDQKDALAKYNVVLQNIEFAKKLQVRKRIRMLHWLAATGSVKEFLTTLQVEDVCQTHAPSHLRILRWRPSLTACPRKYSLCNSRHELEDPLMKIKISVHNLMTKTEPCWKDTRTFIACTLFYSAITVTCVSDKKISVILIPIL